MVDQKKVNKVRGHIHYREISTPKGSYDIPGIHVDLYDTMELLLEVVEENEEFKERIKRLESKTVGI